MSVDLMTCKNRAIELIEIHTITSVCLRSFKVNIGNQESLYPVSTKK